MNPDLLPQRFGGAGETNVHPAVAAALLLVAILMFTLSRRNVIVPFLAAMFLIPIDQGIVVGPFHFPMMRILVTLGWLRLAAMKSSSKLALVSGGVNSIDKAMILCTLFGAVDFVLLWGEVDAAKNQLGIIYTVLGSYFLMRFFIRDREDVVRTIRTFAYVAVPIALCMILEQSTGRNPYSFLGGGLAAARSTLMQREHGIRAMGSFQHPITAGVFGAILAPLFAALWWQNARNRVTAVVGSVAALAIISASVSSTGLLAYTAAIVAFCLWPLRNQMRLIRRGIVICLISLHMIMKAPVWALIGHLGVIGGSDSWHREYVVDQFIRRFGDWWLLGTRDNYNWGWDMWDVTNQYVATGFGGGVLAVIYFVAVIVYGFKYIGKARKAVAGTKTKELLFWALGAALLSNAAAFFGVIYFDQVQVAWYATLAIISVVTAEAFRSQPTHIEHAPVSFFTSESLSVADEWPQVEQTAGFIHREWAGRA